MDSHLLWEALGKRGYRLTAPRLRLLDAIMTIPGHFTVEEIYADVSSVGRATVYRTIKLLVEMRVVCKMVLEDGAPRYRVASPSHHHHLICVACGSSQDFARCAVDDVIFRLHQTTGYRVLSHRIEVYGLCSACQQAEVAAGKGVRWR